MRANMNNKKIKKILFAFGIFMCLTFCGTFSASALTIEDEKKLGKEFYEKLEGKGVFLQDRKISDYFNTIGNRILSQGHKSPFSFTFTVIKNPGINAFATPGGYVYVYSGLIRISENESQLASVLAHEIAHSVVEKSNHSENEAAADKLVVSWGFGKELTKFYEEKKQWDLNTAGQ